MESESTFQLFGRFDGPLHFRLLLQPCVAVIIGYLDGLKDAKTGVPPYFWLLTTRRTQERRAALDQGWSSIGKVFILAVVLDCVYQFIVYKSIAVFSALIVAILVAIVPYLLARGLTNRAKSRK